MISAQFIRFITVSVANAFVGIGMIFISKWILGFGDIAANLIGYGVGITVSFLLNAKYTFNYEGKYLFAAIRFLTIAGLAYLLNLITVVTAIYGLGIHGDIAQLMGVVPYTLFSYFLSKHWVFLGDKPEQASDTPAGQHDPILDNNEPEKVSPDSVQPL